MKEGIARFFTSDLIPAVSNSVKAYLCLRDENLDDVFVDVVQSDATLQLNKYLYIKHAVDPEYLSKLFLPEYQTTLQVCRSKKTLQERLQWLVDTGKLMNVWLRVTFDFVADLLVDTLEVMNMLPPAEADDTRTTKYQYAGEPFLTELSLKMG